MAEFERSLTQERVKAGIAHARAKGKRLGRPSIAVDTARIANLRTIGKSWPAIAREMGISVGKAYEVGQSLSKIPKILSESAAATIRVTAAFLCLVKRLSNGGTR